ncbi:MAG: hypothetical protein Q8L37_03980 [Candidatus Gottesmanbacteria bacterium]|nr:hypothetical protein [Candidatus Gottesmanbacteria bacterium]
MVITRPNHDVTTNYLSFWSQSVIDYADKRSLHVIDLRGPRATRKEFESVLCKRGGQAFIFLNGHGSADKVGGQNNEVLVEVGENDDIFFGTVVYARSCSSAAVLGPASVAKGAMAYLGYTDDFVFFIEDEYMTRPLNDKTAQLFLEPSNQVAMAILKGHSVGEANGQSKDMIKHTIQTLMTSETPKEEKELIPYLRWNLIHQVCLGDTSARLA